MLFVPLEVVGLVYGPGRYITKLLVSHFFIFLVKGGDSVPVEDSRLRQQPRSGYGSPVLPADFEYNWKSFSEFEVIIHLEPHTYGYHAKFLFLFVGEVFARVCR